MTGWLGNKIKLSSSEAVITGALSGVSTRIVISPFDVIKIRLQLQTAPINKKHGGLYKGLFNAVAVVFKEEGLVAFWKGHTASQLLSVVYSGVQFGVFERLSSHITTHNSDLNKPLISLICGGAAGSTACLVSQPCDTIRTRMVMQRPPLTYHSTLSALRMILEREGVRGLYRGVTPNLLQVTPNAALQFGCYTSCVVVYDRIREIEGEALSKTESFVFGAVSGVVAKSVILPFDLTKKRLQVQGFTDNIARSGLSKIPLYNGVLDCVTSVYRCEGIMGFYKGALPSLLKVPCSLAKMTFLYDNMIKGELQTEDGFLIVSIKQEPVHDANVKTEPDENYSLQQNVKAEIETGKQSEVPDVNLKDHHMGHSMACRTDVHSGFPAFFSTVMA